MAARLSTREDYADLLDKYDTWLFDCDGVLWQGDRLVPGVPEVLQLLREKSASSVTCGPACGLEAHALAGNVQRSRLCS